MNSFSRTLKCKVQILEKNGGLWKIKMSVWASVRDIFSYQNSLFENIDFGSAISKNYKIVRLRHNLKIQDTNRIQYNGISYSIVRIIAENNTNKVNQILAVQI